MIVKCLWCLTPFEQIKELQKFCSINCRNQCRLMKSKQKYSEDKGEVYIHLMDDEHTRISLMTLYKNNDAVKSILSAPSNSENGPPSSDMIKKKYTLLLDIPICEDCTRELQAKHNNDPRFFVISTGLEESEYCMFPYNLKI